MGKQGQDEPKKPFPWRTKLGEAARNGLWWGAAGAGTAAITVPEPFTIVISGAIGFVGGAGAYLDGAYVAHHNDDPLPVFNRGTTLLFDTTLTIVGLLLFVVPALQLDLALRPNSFLPGLHSLPGWFGFGAMFLSAFLIPVVRGLICNLGLAREEEEVGKETSNS